MSNLDFASSAVQDLYSDHHSWLQGWLRKRLGNAFDAADLAHDTYVRILSKEEVLRLNEPRAFLVTVAQGVLYNFRRRQRLEQAYLDAIALLPEAQVPSPESRALLLETLTEIDRLLDGLPLPTRRAFLLSQLDGLSHTEIATTLKISIATVKRHIAKAIAQCCLLD